MNIYKKLNEKQIKLVEEAGDIIEDREYSIEEVKQLQNSLASHIFSKSKNDSRLIEKFLENTESKYLKEII